MSSWVEPQYESHPNQPYLHPLDVPDGSMREAEHPPSMVTSYSYTPRPSPNSSRQTYSSGLYGPRPQPSHPEPIQGIPTPAMVPRAMSDLEEEADDEYMEVEPMADSGVPIYSSEFDDEPRQGRRRFVGGFIRGLKKIPKAMRRGFSPQKRELPTPPGLAYYESPYRSQYIDDIEPQEESEAAPPYDAPSDHVEGDMRYADGINMPAEFTSPSPSLTPSHTIHAPRSESQLTYQSLTNPPARHVSQHGSLHHTQRSSPPRTVRNPDPTSPTDDSGTANANTPRFEQPPLESEPDYAYRAGHLSPLAPARRPTVTVQSPTGSPVYFEPPPAEDYAGMDMDSLAGGSPEPSVPTQMSRVAGFFRDLRNLPWISPHVTVDFDPTDGERARYAHTQGTGRSWYTGHLQDLDLLAGDSRRLTRPSGHAFGPAPGSSATLAPPHGSGSASNSSEGASTHLPTAPTLPPYPYPVQTLALPPQPLYYYPFPGMPSLQQQQQQQQPMAHAPEPVSLQSSGNSDIPKQPFLYVVAMPPGYAPGPVDPSRPMQPTFGMPQAYPPPV